MNPVMNASLTPCLVAPDLFAFAHPWVQHQDTDADALRETDADALREREEREILGSAFRSNGSTTAAHVHSDVSNGTPSIVGSATTHAEKEYIEQSPIFGTGSMLQRISTPSLMGGRPVLQRISTPTAAYTSSASLPFSRGSLY